MRYLESETPYIICRFNTGDIVTLDIYDLADNSKDVDAAAMTEIGTTGYFKYYFNPSITTLMEYLYIATNGTEEHAGKIILGGYPDAIKDETDKIQTGIIDAKNDYKATGFATENPPSQNLNDYKADVSTLALEVNAVIRKKMLYNKVTKSGDVITIYEDNGVDIWKQFNLADGGRVEL